MKIALINIWFGKLPSYFPFFAKSCEINHSLFKWFLFTDQVKKITRYNEALNLVPYSWKELCSDLNWFNFPHEVKYLQIWPKNSWPCRYSLMWSKNFQEFDFIGTFDCDVIFGNLKEHMPENLNKYGMISAHSGIRTPKKRWRNCAAFSFFRKDSLLAIKNYKETKEDALDENFNFCEYFSNLFEVFHTGTNIQPLGESIDLCDLNMEYVAIWEKGHLKVEGIPGGMWHLLPQKNHKSFKIKTSPNSSFWHMSKLGIQGKYFL